MNGDCVGAERVFKGALDVFKARETERDLAELYLEYGLLRLQNQRHEEAYLLFEEGAYLAKKLHLVYIRCRFALAMGCLETGMKEGMAEHANAHFKTAENMARKYNFQELLWQVYYYQGKLLLEREETAGAKKVLVRAMSTFKQVIDRVPESFQDTYVKAREAHRLLRLVDEFQAKAEAVE